MTVQQWAAECQTSVEQCLVWWAVHSLVHQLHATSDMLNHAEVPTAANIKGKGTPMVSTAADSRPCDARVWCSSPFHWSWASSELAPGTMDSKPHLFHNLPLPPWFYAGTNLYCMREAHGCKQFAYSHQTAEPNRGLKRRPLECQSNALMLCSLCC